MKTKKELQSIFVITLGFLVLYYFFEKPVFIIVGVVVGICGFLIPALRRKIVWLWFKLGKTLGFINSRILLTLIFFLLLFPIALISRLFSKDKLQLRKKASGEDSYFIKRLHKFSEEDFKNPW